MMDWREQLESQGFAIIPAVLTAFEIAEALAQWDEVCRRNAEDPALLANDGPAYGARNLLQLWPRVMELAQHPRLRMPLRDVLGPLAGVVRVLFFDKPPGHSWALPWHKDYNIAVREHRGGDVFTKPTRKAGVPHVIAPVELLNAMLTARVHLDAANPDNGTLRVVPGSHRHYPMGEDPLCEPVAIHCEAGDVLLMRPLLTHASGHSKVDQGLHRRIVHIECAPSPELPNDYHWHSFHSLSQGSSPC